MENSHCKHACTHSASLAPHTVSSWAITTDSYGEGAGTITDDFAASSGRGTAARWPRPRGTAPHSTGHCGLGLRAATASSKPNQQRPPPAPPKRGPPSTVRQAGRQLLLMAPAGLPRRTRPMARTTVARCCTCSTLTTVRVASSMPGARLLPLYEAPCYDAKRGQGGVLVLLVLVPSCAAWPRTGRTTGDGVVCGVGAGAAAGCEKKTANNPWRLSVFTLRRGHAHPAAPRLRAARDQDAR